MQNKPPPIIGVPRELKRQIRACSFERTAANVHAPAIAQLIKDIYVLEFIRSPGPGPLLERELEQALLDQLQFFLFGIGGWLCLRRSAKANRYRKWEAILY